MTRQLPITLPFPQLALVMEGGQGTSDHPRCIPAVGEWGWAMQGLGMARGRGREGSHPWRDAGQD